MTKPGGLTPSTVTLNAAGAWLWNRALLNLFALDLRTLRLNRITLKPETLSPRALCKPLIKA